MTDTDILKNIKKIIKSSEDITTRINVDDLTEKHLLVEDLGLDSFAMMSIIYELQEEYDSLDEGEMINWKTLEDLIKACK